MAENIRDCEKRALSGNKTVILYRLLFGYGILQGVAAILQILNYHLFAEQYWSYFFVLAFDIIFLVYFLKICTQKRSKADEQYLSGIYAWGIFVAVMPFVLPIVRLIFVCINADATQQGMAVLTGNHEILEAAMLCWMAAMLGFMTNKKWMSPLAVLLMMFFLVCSLCIKTGAFGNVISLLFIFIKVFGYIMLGFIAYTGNKEAC